MENRGTRLFLVRHGEVANHKGEFRYNGHIDVDLSELGLFQMKAVAGRLATESISGIYSSDLVRTMRGASAIADKHGLSPVADKRLKEVAAGRWEGLTFNEVHERFPDESHVRFEDLVNYRIKDGGESLRDVAARVIPALNEIILKHRGESVAMVAHGGVNRVILCHALNLQLENFFRLEQDYGCLNIIDFYENTALVRLVNGNIVGAYRIRPVKQEEI